MRHSILYSVVLASFVSGCATQYKPMGFGGGFEEIQVGQNTWRISARGNGFTSAKRVEEIVLLRSADLALTQGFSYFSVVENSRNTSVNRTTTPTQTYGTFNANTYRGTTTGSLNTYTSGGDTIDWEKHAQTNTVQMFKEKPTDGRFVYEAAYICNSLGPKYETRCGGRR